MANVKSPGTSGRWYLGHCAFSKQSKSYAQVEVLNWERHIYFHVGSSNRKQHQGSGDLRGEWRKIFKMWRMCPQKCVLGSFLTREGSTFRGGISVLESRVRTAECKFSPFSTYQCHFQPWWPNSNIIHLKAPETLSWLSTKWIIPSFELS